MMVCIWNLGLEVELYLLGNSFFFFHAIYYKLAAEICVIRAKHI